MYPEALRKAQEEIDAVVGTNRLPDFNDRPHLPYVNALIKESMRWQLVVPVGKNTRGTFYNVPHTDNQSTGFPHMASDADEYDGYFIPKGTVVIGASW